MTDDIGAIGVNLINDYMDHAMGVCALGGGMLYLFAQRKSVEAKSDVFVGFVGWAMMCGAIPVCVAFVVAAFMPELLAALQNYRLAPALYGFYHVYYTVWKIVIPKLREYSAPRE